MIAETRFLGFGAIAWELETGFLPKFWWGC